MSRIGAGRRMRIVARDTIEAGKFRVARRCLACLRLCKAGTHRHSDWRKTDQVQNVWPQFIRRKLINPSMTLAATIDRLQRRKVSPIERQSDRTIGKGMRGGAGVTAIAIDVGNYIFQIDAAIDLRQAADVTTETAARLGGVNRNTMRGRFVHNPLLRIALPHRDS